ncbi:MAG: SAM-dependent methyltransferase [Synechococcus sp.]|nr:SAM-dependent methyltransferase [Synechococcus sp.]
MSSSAATGVPPWLRERLEAAGGRVPFRTFMEWALHDPEHGAYGAGRLRIGPQGDFATAPSLGPDFAALLAPQLAEWLTALGPGPLALVETGPGEGSLAADLARELARGWPELSERTELVLVEPNAGMAARQRQRLADCPLACRWSGFAELAAAPLRGVVLAHEVLDALAVERIEWDGALWRRQMVALQGEAAAEPSLRLEPGEPLEPAAAEALPALGLLPPSPQRPPGWCSELHPGVEPWLRGCAAALEAGALLVIDYALEAWRYYAPARSGGTLMAYRGQEASGDPLQQPGHRDLTAHLCVDSLLAAAAASGWRPLGHCRQGEALLALGLAERLHGLQQQPAADLATLLARREALLRLVDPHALGDFRWIAMARSLDTPEPLFLQEPGRPASD